MPLFQIENIRSGANLGVYEATDALVAYNYMLGDAGEEAADSIPADISVTEF